MTFGLHGVDVEVHGTLALSDITLAVPAGDVVAVVGGDGAGKTTLMRTLVGEILPTQGRVDVPAPQHIGYLTARSGSWAALTVRQNIDFVAGVYGVDGDELAGRRRELLERAGLADAEDRLASHLSGGMRRKLGFCMAMVHRPQLLVLDEPSTGVDPVSRVDLWRLVSQAAAGGAAVVMSTTYLDEAERAAALLVLDAGRTLAQGTPDEVLQDFVGTVTVTESALRPEWAWRRGPVLHEYWPPDRPLPAGARTIPPDLEDVVLVASLQHRAQVAP